jgi:hypothetical protein
MKSITVYSYRPDTNEYIGTETAYESPVPGIYMYPANTTTIHPFPVKEGYAQILINDQWYYEEDHRGEIWYLIGTDTPIIIDFLGPINQTKYQKNPEIIEPTWDELWVQIRSKRNSLLNDSDYTQLPDVSLTDIKRQEWRVYRQQLRDITTTYTDPHTVVWPTQPS